MQWRISDFRIIRTLYVYVGIILRCFPTLHSENRISDSQYVEYGCFAPCSAFFMQNGNISGNQIKIVYERTYIFSLQRQAAYPFQVGSQRS